MVRTLLAQLHITSGTTYLVADSALYSADTLQRLAEPGTQWITRVPATFTEAHAALAHVDPATMAPLLEGSRYDVLASTYGGVAQRWVRVYSEHRRPQAQRTFDKHLLKQSTNESNAFKNLCRTAFACTADAQRALTPFAHGLQATALHEVTIWATPRYRERGRPSPGLPPDRVGYQIEGALASSLSLKKPERIMALLMVMTVCLLVYAALE